MSLFSRALVFTFLSVASLSTLQAAEVHSAGVTQRQVRIETRPTAMYRLKFTLLTFDGTRDQTRQYTLILEDRSAGKIRMLSKVPVRQGEQTTYVETGVKCDAQFQEIDGTVRLEVEIIFIDIAQPAAQGEPPPINEWQSRVEATVLPNESTVLSTYDGGDTNRRFQLAVTAEKLR